MTKITTEIARLLGRDPICNGRVTMDTVEAIAALVADATAIERERCATLVDETGGLIGPMVRRSLSTAIRKGPTT